jgi:hypothetical protein
MRSNIQDYLDWKDGIIRLDNEYNLGDRNSKDDVKSVGIEACSIESLRLINKDKSKLFNAHIIDLKQKLRKQIAKLISNHKEQKANIKRIIKTIDLYLSNDETEFYTAFVQENETTYTLNYFGIRHNSSNMNWGKGSLDRKNRKNYPNLSNIKKRLGRSYYSLMPCEKRLRKMLEIDSYFIEDCVVQAFILLRSELKEKLSTVNEKETKNILKEKKKTPTPFYRLPKSKLNIKLQVGICFADGRIYTLREKDQRISIKDIAEKIKIPNGKRFIGATLAKRASTKNIYQGKSPELIMDWMRYHKRALHETFISELKNYKGFKKTSFLS